MNYYWEVYVKHWNHKPKYGVNAKVETWGEINENKYFEI